MIVTDSDLREALSGLAGFCCSQPEVFVLLGQGWFRLARLLPEAAG